jgi:hypothetical protein
LSKVEDQISGSNLVGKDIYLLLNFGSANPYPNPLTVYGFYIADTVLDIMPQAQIEVTV